MLGALKAWARRIKQELHALYLAAQDPRVPRYTKALAALVVGYAFSPIDLIPDFIPVLGLLDDAILVPLGIKLVIRLIPREVMEECRIRACEAPKIENEVSWAAGAIISTIWLAVLCWIAWWILAS
jgi:uncharacterized membrane protein YkvA (DUF1232 family)